MVEIVYYIKGKEDYDVVNFLVNRVNKVPDVLRNEVYYLIRELIIHLFFDVVSDVLVETINNAVVHCHKEGFYNNISRD